MWPLVSVLQIENGMSSEQDPPKTKDQKLKDLNKGFDSNNFLKTAGINNNVHCLPGDPSHKTCCCETLATLATQLLVQTNRGQ